MTNNCMQNADHSGRTKYGPKLRSIYVKNANLEFPLVGDLVYSLELPLVLQFADNLTVLPSDLM